MRSIILAVAAMLVAGVATSAFAAERRQNPPPKPSYDTCESLAIQRGAGPGWGGGTNANAQHAAFMKQCLAGEIPQ